MLSEDCFWLSQIKKNLRRLTEIPTSDRSKNYFDFLAEDFLAEDFLAQEEVLEEDDFLAQEDLLQPLESCSTAIDQKYSS